MKGIGMPTKPIQAIPLDTIGVSGLDTQTTPTALDATWFTKADNIVYTEGGKVTFRKGLKQGTLGAGSKIGSIVEHFDGTNTKQFCSYGGTIAELDLTDKNAAFINTYTSSASTPDWQFQNFNNELLAFQGGADLLHYHGGVWGKMKDNAGYNAPANVTTFDPSCGLGYYGRAWAGGISEEKDVVYYSDLLDAHKWSSGSGGYIDLKTVWGRDEIIAIHPFAGKLAIFGKENIVLYNGVADINDLNLDEVIRGVGCVSRDSIQAIGDDLFFLSDTGVRSLMRTAQLDKLPLMEKSVTIKDELIANIKASTNVKSAYMLDEGLYLLSFVDSNVTYVFDITYKTQRDTPRISKWSFGGDRHPASLAYTDTYGLLIGQHLGRVSTYEGYWDVDYSGSSVYTYNAYTSGFSTVWIDLGQGVQTSILKRLVMVVSGGQGTDVGLRVYKDFETTPKISPTFKLNPTLSGTPALWGGSTSLYATSKYAPIHGWKEHSIPLAGAAKYLRLEMDGVTKGYKASLQSLSLLFKQGKTL
jgi:hypothetical protein